MDRRSDTLAMQFVNILLHEVDFLAKAPRALRRLAAKWAPESQRSPGKLRSALSLSYTTSMKYTMGPALWHKAAIDKAQAHFITHGEAHLRCAAWDLLESERRSYASKDCLERLQAAHKHVSAARDTLDTVIATAKRKRSPEVLMEAWRFYRDAVYFHKMVKEETGICAELGTRKPRISGLPSSRRHTLHGSSVSLTVPLIDLQPPSPSLWHDEGSEHSDPDDTSVCNQPLRHLDHFFDQVDTSAASASLCAPYQDALYRLEAAAKEPYHALQETEFTSELDVDMDVDTSTADPFSSTTALISAESVTETYDHDLDDRNDDECDEVLEANIDSDTPTDSDTDSELDRELLTAEIKIGTPTIASAACEGGFSPIKPIQLPALPAELVFTKDPYEYIDRTLNNHGEDPRKYWEIPFSRLAPPDVANIANTLAGHGLEAALALIEQYSVLVRDWLAQQDGAQKPLLEPETRAVTSELVSPSDPVVGDSPRRALAGAVGDVRAPLQPAALSALDLAEPSPLVLAPRTPKFDEDPAADAGTDAPSGDADSMLAWPYGPSRTTTLDNPVQGPAPTAHLGDQFAAMLAVLPERVSAPPSPAGGSSQDVNEGLCEVGIGFTEEPRLFAHWTKSLVSEAQRASELGVGFDGGEGCELAGEVIFEAAV